MIQRMEGYKFMFLNGTVSLLNFGFFLTVKSSPRICLILGVLFRVMCSPLERVCGVKTDLRVSVEYKRHAPPAHTHTHTTLGQIFKIWHFQDLNH